MYDCIVASVGRSVIRKRMFLYSISEGAGRMLLDLMFALFALITLVRKKNTIMCRLFQILWRGKLVSSGDAWKYLLLLSDVG